MEVEKDWPRLDSYFNVFFSLLKSPRRSINYLVVISSFLVKNQNCFAFIPELEYAKNSNFKAPVMFIPL
jgi:hypothetical protein